MEIRLYKNCKLTQEHNNVFNSQSVFESYLSTLDDTAYNLSLADVYYSVNSDGTGSLPIDFNYVLNDQILGHINEFNYIRFTDTYYNIVRYCFVTSIAIQNGIAVINYLEDIWHNYVYGLSIDRCIISQRHNTGTNAAKNIINYEGKNAPILYRFYQLGDDITYEDQLMVVKFQLYKTGQSGEITERYPLCGVVFYKNTSNEDSTLIYSDRNNIADFLYKSAQKMDSVNLFGSLYPGVVPGNYNIDITDIYIIPKNYINGTYDFSNTGISFNDQIKLSTTGNEAVSLNISIFTEGELTNTITYNPFSNMPEAFGYKTIAVGNYSMAIPFSYDGNENTEIKVYFKTDVKSFMLFYSINNQLVEITECYNYNYPINIETAENLQLQQINRKLANDTYERSKASLITDTAKGVATFASGLASISMGNIGGGFQSVVSGAVEPVDTFIELKNSQQRLETITNAGLYTSNSGVSATSNAVLNADVELLLYQIDSINDDTVESVSDKFGRVCNIYVDSLITTGVISISTTMSYEYFIISKCDITGSAPNNILMRIKNILKRGVRIWRVTTL